MRWLLWASRLPQPFSSWVVSTLFEAFSGTRRVGGKFKIIWVGPAFCNFFLITSTITWKRKEVMDYWINRLVEQTQGQFISELTNQDLRANLCWSFENYKFVNWRPPAWLVSQHYPHLLSQGEGAHYIYITLYLHHTTSTTAASTQRRCSACLLQCVAIPVIPRSPIQQFI